MSEETTTTTTLEIIEPSETTTTTVEPVIDEEEVLNKAGRKKPGWVGNHTMDEPPELSGRVEED